jgi:hypothetical protein
MRHGATGNGLKLFKARKALYNSRAIPTVNRSCVRHKNRVLRVELAKGGGIAFVECLVSLFTDRTKLQGYLWIGPVFLLGEGWRSKADCQPYKGNYQAYFHCLLRGFRTICHLTTCCGAPRSAVPRSSDDRSFDRDYGQDAVTEPGAAFSFATKASPKASDEKGCWPLTSSRSSTTFTPQRPTRSTCAPACANASAT